MRSAFFRANAARDAGHWRLAAKQYRRFLRYDSGNFAIWVQLGHMLGEAGDAAAADQAYRTADAINPGDADLALCRGHLAHRNGDIDQAAAFYRESLALDGNDRAAQALAAMIGPEGESEAALTSASGPDPEPLPQGGVLQGWFEREVSGVLFDTGDKDPWL